MSKTIVSDGVLFHLVGYDLGNDTEMDRNFNIYAKEILGYSRWRWESEGEPVVVSDYGFRTVESALAMKGCLDAYFSYCANKDDDRGVRETFKIVFYSDLGKNIIERQISYGIPQCEVIKILNGMASKGYPIFSPKQDYIDYLYCYKGIVAEVICFMINREVDKWLLLNKEDLSAMEMFRLSLYEDDDEDEHEEEEDDWFDEMENVADIDEDHFVIWGDKAPSPVVRKDVPFGFIFEIAKTAESQLDQYDVDKLYELESTLADYFHGLSASTLEHPVIWRACPETDTIQKLLVTYAAMRLEALKNE